MIKHLEAAGVVRELTGKQRGRVFAYDKYLQILDEGTGAAGDSPQP